MTWQDMDGRRDTSRADLTPEEQATVDDVLDAAQAFACGMLPFYEAAAIGTLTDWRGNVSPAYTRYIAITRTPKSDPRTRDLLALLNVLIRKEGYIVTQHGVFRPEEIRANEAGWANANFERDAA